MKRRMYWSLCISSFLMVLAASVLILGSVYELLLRQAKADLIDQYELISNSIAYMDTEGEDYLEMLDQNYQSCRITIIQTDGAVLFDSDGNHAMMESHENRPEVAAAFSKGSGEDIRQSQTMGVDNYYYARKMGNGTVLRISKATSSIGAVFVSIVPALLIILILVLVSSMVIASKLTNRLIRPIDAFASSLYAEETSGQAAVYPELEPIFTKIKEQNRLIGNQIKKLRDDRETIGLITSNMKEGLVLLGLDNTVLSVNNSAISLLGAKKAKYEGKHMLSLLRNSEISACVEQAIAGNSADTQLWIGETYCHIYASPVYQQDVLCGAILLVVDRTEKQKAEQIRRDFTANVSHELKTPLTSISGFAEMIEQGMVADSGDIKAFAGRIHDEANRLVTLTDDIMRLAQIEDNKALSSEEVDLFAVCNDVVASLAFQAQQKGVRVKVGGTRAKIIGEPTMCFELVYNLVDNAIKYNRPDGTVYVRVKQQDGEVLLSVSDSGIGISTGNQERIFERFYRVDKSRSKETGGTGLGLSIVKHVAEKHHGKIELESTPGKGTTITVCFPDIAEAHE